MSKKVLITSALLYANGPLHFGHLAGAYLPADCYARFMRLMGNDVLYISGSDEYGVAITLSAEIAKRSCQEHVDHFHKVNQELFEKLSFSFDYFGRTTDKIHDEDTVAFFNDLMENGHIEKKCEKHLYSKEENRFLADRYVQGTCPKCAFESARGDECPECSASFDAQDLINPRSKLTNSPLIEKESTHWYLRFDHFIEKLLPWIESKGWKDNVVQFAKNYIEDLKPRSITRDSSWGIPLPIPEGKDKVFYVWFDAPIGYISMAKRWALENKTEKWKDFWLDQETKLVHFIGKDNIPFHTVFFPAMLMGQNTPYKLPDQVPANEFLLLEGKQFSKSEGWYIDLQEFLNTYTTDQVRYYLASIAPETSDSDFSFKGFLGKCNSDLLGKLGNLVHRTLTFAKNFCEAKIPPKSTLMEDDLEFIKQTKLITEKAELAYTTFRLRKAAHHLMELCQLANTYFDRKTPWKLVKSETSFPQARTTIHLLIESIKNIALIASPIIPESAQKIWELIAQDGQLSQKNWMDIMDTPIKEDTPLPEPKVLFTKIEDEAMEKELSKLGNKKNLDLEPLKENIQFDDFIKLDLRVGQILSCEKVPKSKKLFKLQVDIGLETRTIVSGIAKHFSEENLIGKKIIVVANIPPAKLMGIESEGMILAASLKKDLTLPEIADLPVGSTVN